MKKSERARQRALGKKENFSPEDLCFSLKKFFKLKKYNRTLHIRMMNIRNDCNSRSLSLSLAMTCSFSMLLLYCYILYIFYVSTRKFFTSYCLLFRCGFIQFNFSSFFIPLNIFQFRFF